MIHRIGLVQMNSGSDLEQNSQFAEEKIKDASEEGLSLIAFPEVFLLIGEERNKKFEIAQSIDGPLVTQFQEYAKKYSISILMGSIYEKINEHPDQLYNTSILLSKAGEVLGVYRKIHLYDINTPTVKIMESRDIKSGSECVLVDHEIGKIGMSVCYDLRFPAFFQHLAEQGAQIIFVPSAFFLQTGKDHWMPLLRARAIENQVYIAAPAQWGWHYGKRSSYGHTVLIDPWGTVVSRASERSEVVIGSIDLEYLQDVRNNMPVEEHRRPQYYK